MSQPPSRKQENRELIELLNELRIVLPGVQVLFAFLLTVPLIGRFETLTTFEKRMYVIAFLASNRLAVIGLAFLAVAMVAVVGLVTALITTDGLSLLFIILAAVFIGVLWFGIPLSRRYRVDRNHEGDGNHD